MLAVTWYFSDPNYNKHHITVGKCTVKARRINRQVKISLMQKKDRKLSSQEFRFRIFSLQTQKHEMMNLSVVQKLRFVTLLHNATCSGLPQCHVQDMSCSISRKQSFEIGPCTPTTNPLAPLEGNHNIPALFAVRTLAQWPPWWHGHQSGLWITSETYFIPCPQKSVSSLSAIFQFHHLQELGLWPAKSTAVTSVVTAFQH
jgi:hypothetical protein